MVPSWVDSELASYRASVPIVLRLMAIAILFVTELDIMQ